MIRGLVIGLVVVIITIGIIDNLVLSNKIITNLVDIGQGNQITGGVVRELGEPQEIREPNQITGNIVRTNSVENQDKQNETDQPEQTNGGPLKKSFTASVTVVG